ncbi:MAG: lipopolysaccharide biosynthesis protein [Prevotella sp.]|nr:lipopolysaccharide biosynthesis protein [Prevotella sp.]
MAGLKSLMKDTAIYGMSSIAGRFLNYLLVPLYTYYMPKASGDYGVSVNIYAYTALILVVLTFGMETTFFRFANKEGEKADTVFSTGMLVVGCLSAVFLALVFAFTVPICNALGYANHRSYVLIMAVTVALDAVKALPFSYLRFEKKALLFAGLQLLNILLNVVLNVVFFVFLGRGQVLWVFAINLLCSALIFLCFVPRFFRIRWSLDFGLLRRMLSYSWPILVLGIAGILNQTADKIIYPLICPGKLDELGVYGACVKIAMIMAMITQAFRYAYEPIVFAKVRDDDAKSYYAAAMKFFIVFTLFAFLCVTAYMNVLQHIIGREYRSGLVVVPIVMLAEIMMGVYFNLSFWYKTIDKTLWGAVFSGIGCLALVAVNVCFIPTWGYMACAWGGVFGYGIPMILSYIVGQRINPIAYPLRSILIYTLLAAVFFALMELLPKSLPAALRLGINTVLVLAYAAHAAYHDLPIASLPVIRRFVKK